MGIFGTVPLNGAWNWKPGLNRSMDKDTCKQSKILVVVDG